VQSLLFFKHHNPQVVVQSLLFFKHHNPQVVVICNLECTAGLRPAKQKKINKEQNNDDIS